MNLVSQLGRIAAREMVKAAQQPESAHQPRRPSFTAQFPGHLNDLGDPSSYSHVPANPMNAPAMASNMPANPTNAPAMASNMPANPWAPEPPTFNEPQGGPDPFAAPQEVGTQVSEPVLQDFPPRAPTSYDRDREMIRNADLLKPISRASWLPSFKP